MAFILTNGANKYKFPMIPQKFTYEPHPKTAIQKTIGGVVVQFLGFYVTFTASGLVNTKPLDKGGLEGEEAALATFIEECHMAQKEGQSSVMTFDEKGLIEVPVAIGDFSITQEVNTVAFTYTITMYENQMSNLKQNNKLSEYFDGIIKEIGFSDTGTGWHGGNGSTETSLKFKQLTGWPGLVSTSSGSTSQVQANAKGSAIMTPSQAQAYAKALAQKEYGWGATQWGYLYKVWEKESRWNMHAENQYSGAYGIPQANPKGGHPIADSPSYRNNAMTQIQWGLKYIKDRYGNPEGAWQSEVDNGWY